MNGIGDIASWARRVGLAGKLALALALASIVSGVATYGALTSAPLGGPGSTEVKTLLIVDVVLLLMLGAVVARRMTHVWNEGRKGGGGSRLHRRLVLLFSGMAVTPAIIVAVFSALFFHLGVEAWFDKTVQRALLESNAVARAYLEEHQHAIAGDALAMAAEINRDGYAGLRGLGREAASRGLAEAIVFDPQGRVLARSGFSFSIELAIEQIPLWAIERARNGEVAVIDTDDDDRVRALVRLDSASSDAYLFVGRFVDPKVIGHMERTADAVSVYQSLEGRRSYTYVTLTTMFLLVALLLLMAAAWMGLNLANQLARPIGRLIGAAEKVGEGDLTVRVDDLGGQDDMALLSRAFNRMTSELSSQRQRLVDANRELDERRRFTETVLAGVSAGVIGLDAEGSVTLPNRSAADLLGVDFEAAAGLPLAEVVPEMGDVLDQVRRRPDRLLQAEVMLPRADQTRVLLVRVAAERLDSEVIGYVVTFDDITELVNAQRKAAWADVARRIAHEIKNPLTPIQLSAERLKRKYQRQIQTDVETFVTCTDTIIRQVGDIGRMVDEFSAFARMPAPVMRAEDLCEIARQAVFLQRGAWSGITVEARLPDAPLEILCDGRQVGQAMTNLIKNAAESILGRDGLDLPPGRVLVTLSAEGERVRLVVEDNGRGLPRDLRDRLTEPYVTTRTKGTGLGLAIVKKIMEDHGGFILLEDAEGQGARVILIFPAGEPAPSKWQSTATHGDA
ncbi:MAG: PAS domain-containing sensor histidine kinase [Alphaproteobacteria bacterium]|nr:PAS domain-containing sensor histidine kinase [Alphaproteobacteria bacterium]